MLGEVEARLEAQVPEFAGRVRTARDFARVQASGAAPSGGVTVYVLPASTQGIPTTASGLSAGLFRQAITRGVAVVTVLQSTDPLGARALDRIYLGANATIPYDLHQVLKFKVELAPSGAVGTAPAWGPLLRACGVAETITAATSVVYNPISDGFESVTGCLHIDGHLFKLLGARGNCDLTLNASGIPYLEFTFTGLWTKPTDASLPTPGLTAFQKPRVASNANTPTFTIGGEDHVLRSFKLGFGNQVEPRFLVNRDEIVIVDRSETIEAQIEATALSSLDPYALARDQDTVPLVLAHGTTAGNIATLSVPAAQMMRPGAPTEAQGFTEWPLNLTPLPEAGNDQWTLTLT